MKKFLLFFALMPLMALQGCDKTQIEKGSTGERPGQTGPVDQPQISVTDNKYYISMWNYLPLGERDEEFAVMEWDECGINLPMTFEYTWKTDKSLMFTLLDKCAERGLKAIVCDERTNVSRLQWAIQEYGEAAGIEEFRKGVAEAMADFGDHPAVYGFHVGDEPSGDAWELAITAFKIVQDANPSLTAFINMLPYSDVEWFLQSVNCSNIDDYRNKLIDFINRSGAKIISYDYYGQCSYVDKEFYQGEYFRNLQLFNSVAQETGTKLFVTLLSVGHLYYEVPDEDDFRWQLYTAVAHGAEGIHWFQFYDLNQPSGTYRDCPINRFGERTQTYEYLSNTNRLFMVNFSDKLSKCKFQKVWHFGKCYGGTPEFDNENELINIKLKNGETDVFKGTPELVITKWLGEDGKYCYTIVNMDRTLPDNFYVFCSDYLNTGHHYEVWLAPGQMVYIDQNGIYNN